ncbi:MAG TPA: DNA repair protein RadC [bacterium]
MSTMIDAPRELLARDGAATLSDAQLLGLLLRTGARGPGNSAVEIGTGLLARHGGIVGLDRATFRELCTERGLGPAKAAGLMAALELGRRLVAGDARQRPRLTSSREVAGLYTPRLFNLPREVFIAVLLNARNEVIREITIAVGCLTGSLVHPRELFQPAVRDSAAALILVHNHPSGDPTPSPEDVQLTERLVEAGRILGIRVLDHVVVAQGGYASLMDRRSQSN